MTQQITGYHVFGMFVAGFAVIIGVNIALAYNAVHTFPGLEVKNSYVASQSFDVDRAAQDALGWSVEAALAGDELILRIDDAAGPVAPVIEKAVFGRAATTAADQTPAFTFDGTAFRAPVEGGPGNWNLRITLRAEDGTVFQRRIVIRGGA